MDENQIIDKISKSSGKSIEDVKKLISDKIAELSGLVTEEGAASIIANELNVKLETRKMSTDSELVKIDQITEAKMSVSFNCKVIKKYDKISFGSGESAGSVQSMLVGDDTGITRLTFWNDKCEMLNDIDEKNILGIENGYSKENKLNPQRIDVTFSQYSELTKSPSGVEITLKEFEPISIEFMKKKIEEIEDTHKNIKIDGTITSVEIPRFYYGSPKTFKKVIQDEGKFFDKDTQEEIEPIKIPIVNLLLDDGSGILNIVGFRDRAEQLTNTKDIHLTEMGLNPEKFEELKSKLIGVKIEVGGNVSLNNMTGEKQLIVNEIINTEFKKTDMDEVAKEIVEEDKKKDEKKDDLLDEIEEIDFDDDL